MLSEVETSVRSCTLATNRFLRYGWNDGGEFVSLRSNPENQHKSSLINNAKNIPNKTTNNNEQKHKKHLHR